MDERLSELDWHAGGLVCMVGAKALDTWISVRALRDVPRIVERNPVPVMVYPDHPLLAMWVLSAVALLLLVAVVETGMRYTAVDDVWMYGMGYWAPGVLWVITALNNAVAVAKAGAMF